jgi:hypothetical protein
MTRSRIAGAVLSVLLGAGLLARIANDAGVPPRNPARPPVENPCPQRPPHHRDGGPEEREPASENPDPCRTPETRSATTRSLTQFKGDGFRPIQLDWLLLIRRMQIWNRYTYVMNNPLSFVDPSGPVISEVA